MKKDQQTPTATPALPPLTLAEAREIERERAQDASHTGREWFATEPHRPFRGRTAAVRDQANNPEEYQAIGIGNGAVHIGFASITSCVSVKEAKANAELWAAAPELLAGLEAAETVMDNAEEYIRRTVLPFDKKARRIYTEMTGQLLEGVRIARAALAKAKGRK